MTVQMSLDVGATDRATVAAVAVPGRLHGADPTELRAAMHPSGGVREGLAWWTTRYGLHWGEVYGIADGKASWAEIAEEVAA